MDTWVPWTVLRLPRMFNGRGRGGNTDDGLASLSVDAIASYRLSSSNIVQALVAQEVDEWVQESKRGLVGSDKPVVQKRDYTSEDGSRAAGTTIRGDLSLDHHQTVNTRCRDIRKAAARLVELSSVHGTKLVEIPRNSFRLIFWTREVVGKTAAGKVGRDLWNTLRRTH